MKKQNDYRNVNISVEGGIVDVGRVPAGIRVIVKDHDNAKVGEKCRSVYEGKPAPVKLSTVNVIEFNGDNKTDVLSLHSFLDNEEGNKAAEELFRKMAIENGGKEEEVDAATEDGCYDILGYTLVITHST